MLFEIDPRPYAADLERAEAELQPGAHPRGARRQGSGTGAEPLVAVQAISREEFDSRTSGNAEADAAIRGAEAAVRPRD